MIEPAILVLLFETSYKQIRQQTEGLTHADSLLQPPFGGNCLNWTLGHIIQARNRVLGLLGEPRVWNNAEVTIYVRDSEPITDANAHVARPFDTLLADLDRSQERLLAGITRCAYADFAGPSDIERFTLGERLAFLSQHESYHTGQMELLRHLAGRHEKVN